MEWWSAWGRFDGLGTLFVGLWRYRGPGFQRPGTMASHALIDDAGRVVSRRALVDTTMLAGARRALTRAVGVRADPLLATVLELTEGERLFAPYELIADATDPEALAIGDHRLQLDASYALRFELGDSAYLQLPAGAEPVWLGGSDGYAAGVSQMRGYGTLVPRATLAWGGATYTGSVFGGHHWGPWALFGLDQLYFHPEWQAFALQLEDGRSLLLRFDQQPNRQAGTAERHLVASYVHMRDTTGGVTRAMAAHVESTATLESLRTSNRYDRAFRLAIPELAAELQIETADGDHELPVFSPHRGVLEAPCTVTGQIAGQPVRGSGYAEVFGKSPDINAFFWGNQKSHLADELERFVPRTHSPAFMQRVCRSDGPLALDARDVEHALLSPIWSMMDRGGKGWRSTWLMLCCHALGDDSHDERIRPFLPIIELLHTGSLIIDDIQDGSPIRRGKPAVHHQVGVDLAINVGSFLYFLPQLIVEEAAWLSAEQRADIYRHINVALRQGHVGQAMDLMWAKRDRLESSVQNLDRTRAELLTQYRLKSGCQLEAIARIAGTLVSAPAARIEALSRYACEFGVAFQIADDILDTHGAFEKLGKQSGEDFANGKLNVVLLYALARADADTRASWCERMGAGRDTLDLDGLRKVVMDTGAVEHATAEAERLLDTAFAPMADALPFSEHVVVMRSVPRWLLRQRTR